MPALTIRGGFGLALKLRTARILKGLTLHQAARLAGAGCGWRSISSWETGLRIERMKLWQLDRLLTVYGMDPAEFFAWKLTDEHRRLAAWGMRTASRTLEATA